MAIAQHTTLTLVPAQFFPMDDYGHNVLLDTWGDRVFIEFDTCSLCNKPFLGTLHNDPGDNPIELAISYCGCTIGGEF